ncbi:MAG: FecR family protein [Butyricimonas faecihominis]
MKELDKYIRMCRLAIKQRFTRTNQQEREELNSWLNESDENRKLYDAIDQVDPSELKDYYSQTDVEIQLSRFYRKCAKRLIAWHWSAAAIIILVSGISFYTMTRTEPIDSTPIMPQPDGVSLVLSNGRQINLSTSNHRDTMEIGSAIANVKQNTLVYTPSDTLHATEYNTLLIPRGTFFHLMLSDGTRIWLNADTKITYPVTFANGNREVYLEGEAFFDVKKNESAPFTVKTDRLNVRVLGTEFNVNTFADNGHISTALVKGAVEVFGTNGEVHRLHPGQVATMNTDGKIRVTQPELKPYVAWVDDMFCFRNTPLSEILKQVERYYNVKVIYGADYQEEYYTGDISRNKPLQTLLDVVEMTIPVKFELLDQVIYIKKKG